MVELPRLMFAADASGSGKTSLTCAFLILLARRGLRPCAFKCGPDYIDPMFHRQIAGVDSWNLDLFFSDGEQVRQLMSRHGTGRDIAVVEGVMGYYDGVAGTDRASSWDLARQTGTPAVLVVSPGKNALTQAAQLRGIAAFRTPSCLSGLLLNRCSPGQYAFLAPLLERETGLPVLGYVPEVPECALPSRHLGLVMPSEVAQIGGRLERLAQEMAHTVDIDRLLTIAQGADPLPAAASSSPKAAEKRVRIGVARDEAFCFYYGDNLLLLEALGAELVFFSPLRDEHLPNGLHGLYLGGGYPELHCPALSGNVSMRQDVRRAVETGLPTVAECGGFLYLQRELADPEGGLWPMAGVLPGRAAPAPRQGRFGYVTLTALRPSDFLREGEQIAAHEFHRWDTDWNGDLCLAQKPSSSRSWPCVLGEGALFAGFPHLYFPSFPPFVQRFVQACMNHQEAMTC